MKTFFIVHQELEKEKGFLPPPHFRPTDKKPPRNKSLHKPPRVSIFIENKQRANELLKKYDLEFSTKNYEYIQEHGILIASDVGWELYEYDGYKYFYRNDHFETLLIKDSLKIADKTKYLIFLTILANITFILFYIFLLKKLQPLQRLKQNIVKFSKGDLNIDTSCNGKDEISEVSNEFNNAIKEIRNLTESRNLFLRNIMHELKTPITKGGLISDMMEDGKHQESLKRVFLRLQYLLQEFAKIEQLTSNNIKLHKKDYRVIDIIDEAIDILLIDKEQLEFNIQENIIVNVDYSLFALALKNLIDNGIKYGKSPVYIELQNKTLSIATKGEKLKKSFEEYLQAFNRDYETSAQSLGLGLYIINSILKLHQLKLEYKYENKQNVFFIEFNS